MLSSLTLACRSEESYQLIAEVDRGLGLGVVHVMDLN